MDEMDRRILRLLAEDGRMSLAAVGTAVGLSGPAVYERVRKLERSDVIRGYRAVLDRMAVGRPALAFVEVDLNVGVPADDLLASLAADEAVVEAHRVFGPDGLLLKVALEDVAALSGWTERLRLRPAVAATRTRVVGATAFERGLSVPDGPAAQGRRQAAPSGGPGEAPPEVDLTR